MTLDEVDQLFKNHRLDIFTQCLSVFEKIGSVPLFSKGELIGTYMFQFIHDDELCILVVRTLKHDGEGCTNPFLNSNIERMIELRKHGIVIEYQYVCPKCGFNFAKL